MTFDLLIDTPGYAVAMIDGELCELSFGHLTDDQVHDAMTAATE